MSVKNYGRTKELPKDTVRHRDLPKRAYNFGIQAVGAILGIPLLIASLVLDAPHVFSHTDRQAIFALFSCLYLGVLPCCACFSSAMTALPPADVPIEADISLRRNWRIMFGKYVIGLFPIAAISLGVAWRIAYKGQALPSGVNLNVTLSVLAFGFPILAVGCWVGNRLGASARRGGGKRLARLLYWCWRVCP